LRPNVQTRAWLEYPYQIALAKLTSRYQRALDLLEEKSERLVFPIDRFQCHAARALIFHQTGVDKARDEADLALIAAAERDSGFSRHPGIGLVRDRQAQVLEQLGAIGDD
jgi:hypothetical protein